MTDFSEKLIQCRRHAGMTQQQAADAIGVHRCLIAWYENGRHLPPANTVIALCALYGADAAALLDAAAEQVARPYLEKKKRL